MISIDTLTLPELAPYIRGMKFTGPPLENEAITPELLQEFVDKLHQYPLANQLISKLNHPSDFYNTCTDFKEWFPKKQQQRQLFYAAKLDYLIPNTYPEICFYITEALKRYPAPNLVIKQLNKSLLRRYLTQNAVSLEITISNIYGKAYTVFDDLHLRNDCGDFFELYIPKEDMVALAPAELADKCTDDVLQLITLSDNGLVGPDGMLLTELLGPDYITNSFYDLRQNILTTL